MRQASLAALYIPALKDGVFRAIWINGKTMPFMTENTSNRYYDAGRSDLSFKSVSELQALLGDLLRALRQSKDLDQITTAEKAGISEKALRNLEAGRGSTGESFLRALKALDSLDGLELRWAGIEMGWN